MMCCSREVMVRRDGMIEDRVFDGKIQVRFVIVSGMRKYMTTQYEWG